MIDTVIYLYSITPFLCILQRSIPGYWLPFPNIPGRTYCINLVQPAASPSENSRPMAPIMTRTREAGAAPAPTFMSHVRIPPVRSGTYHGCSFLIFCV